MPLELPHSKPAELVQRKTSQDRLNSTISNSDLRGVRARLTSGAGLLLRICSISSNIAGVNFGMTSSALRFSTTCSGFDAPRMTVLVVGMRATQAKAS